MYDWPMTAWKPELVHLETDYALGHTGPLFVVVWRRQSTVVGIRHQHSALHAFAHAERRGLVTIVEASARLPEADALEMQAAFRQSNAERVAVSAFVYEGGGFKSAAVRGVVTGLTMKARQSYPHRAFESVAAAAPWFCERAPKAWDLGPERFEAEIARVRQLFETDPAD